MPALNDRASNAPTLGERLHQALVDIEKPVIAAINGVAVGGGCTLTLLCDIRVAAESARFQLPFTKLGLSAELGSTYLLPRLLGMGKAMDERRPVELHSHIADIQGITFNGDARMLATNAKDGILHIWRMDDLKKHIASLQAKNSWANPFLPNGKSLWVRTKDNNLGIYDTTTPSDDIQLLESGMANFFDIRLHPNGQWIAYGGYSARQQRSIAILRRSSPDDENKSYSTPLPHWPMSICPTKTH